jgi:putative membrane protein
VGILLRWVVGVAALYVTVWLGEKLKIGLSLESGQNGIVSAFLVILALTLVNAFIRPVVAFFAAPLNCLTLGLMGFVINALMFWLVGQFDLGLKVNGFVPALFGSLVLSIVSGILNTLVVEASEEK